jgi:hypothetical protein
LGAGLAVASRAARVAIILAGPARAAILNVRTRPFDPALDQEFPLMLPLRIAVVLLFVAGLAVPRSAAAQQEKALADPVVGKLDQRVMRFLEAVAGGDENDAFADLLVGSQLVEQEEAVRSLVERSKEIAKRYGAHRESEQLAARRIGKDLVLLKYLFKCEKFPVIWYIAFYRDFSRQANNNNDDQWVVISVRFDTQVDRLFE